MELTNEEAALLKDVLEQAIGHIDDSKNAMTEDGTMPDMDTLLEVTATADRHIALLYSIIERIENDG